MAAFLANDGKERWPMITINANGHVIQVQTWSLTGKEVVWYDGRVVAQGRSIGGSTYSFQVVEEGKTCIYEVEMGLRWHGCSFWAKVRRNGVLIYSNH